MKKPDICQICLRLDRELKVVDQRLSNFHDELCDYVLDPLNSQYCFECAYLLKKVYNFQVRCKNAIFVFKKWKKTKAADKKPANLLYTLLPPTSLGLWTPDNNKVYTFTREDLEPGSTVPSESNGDKVLSNDIKTEAEFEDDSKDSQLLHSFHPQPLKTFEEVTVNNGHFNSEHLNDNDIMLNDDDIKKENDLNAFTVSDDEIDVNKKSEKKNSYLISRDHCYTRAKEEHKDPTKSKSLTKLADMSLTDNDFNCDDDTEVKSDGDSTDESDDIGTPTFETDESNTDDVDDDEEKTQSSKTKTKDKGDDTKLQKKTKKVAKIELMNISIHEEKQNVILKKEQFDKDRLMAVVEKKLAAVGEIKASDGATIDKQFILTCLNEKVNEYTLKLLWNAVQRGRQNTNLKPRALNIFRTIHIKYRNYDQYESVFEIEYLNTEEKVLGEFQRRKTYECYRNAEHKCGICYQGFKHEKLLENHSKCHQESAGSVACAICGVYCKKEYIDNTHMRVCHEAVFKCKLCPLITYRRESMINHYDQHQGKQYRCELCGLSYRSVSAYRTHRSLSHPTPHVCTLCGRSFFSAVVLKTHKARMHSDHVPTGCGVECSECALTFASHEVYLRHVRSAHKGVLPDGTRPQRLKPRANPHKCRMTCRVCNAVGTGYGWLSQHFRVKHPTFDMNVLFADKRKHLCEVCGKAFSNSYMLRHHMNKHTGSRPFVCGTCFKRFHGYRSLQNHRLTHLPPTKRCPQCGKMFRTSAHLSVHIRSHTRDRCYKCNICGKGFLHSSSLNAHVRGVHHHMRRVKKKGVTEAGAKKVASHAEENSE